MRDVMRGLQYTVDFFLILFVFCNVYFAASESAIA